MPAHPPTIPTPPINLPPSRISATLLLLILPATAYIVLLFIQFTVVRGLAEIADDFDVRLSTLAAWVVRKPAQLLLIGTGVMGFAIALTFATKSTRPRLVTNLLTALVLCALIGVALAAMVGVMSAVSTGAAAGSGAGPTMPASSPASTGP